MPLYEPGEYVFDYLKNGSSVEMNVDGSVTPVNFKYTVPADRYLYLTKIIVVIIDDGMTWGEFAGLNAALTSGFELRIFDEDDTLLLDVTNSEDIKTNEDFAFLGGNDVLTEPAAGDDALLAVADMNDSGEHPMILAPGDYIQGKVQDDLTAVTKFRCALHGRLDTQDVTA